MPSVPDVGGPLTLKAKFTIAASTQVGLRPRAETPSVGGAYKPQPEFEMVAIRPPHSLGAPFEADKAVQVATDVF